jgi:hypothetical protein
MSKDTEETFFLNDKEIERLLKKKQGQITKQILENKPLLNNLIGRLESLGPEFFIFEKFEDKEVEDGEMSLSQVLKVLKKTTHKETDISIFGPNPDNVCLYVKDESGISILELEENWDFEAIDNEDGVMYDDPNLLFISEELKGTFYSFELELQNDFDIRKLQPIKTEIGESIEVFTGLVYDGIKLEPVEKMIDMEGDGGFNFYLTYTN